MKKCDVIIPVYKSPEWVKLCIYALFKNTNEKVLGTVYLVNDCNDELTKNCLNNLDNFFRQIAKASSIHNVPIFVNCVNEIVKSIATIAELV